MADHARTEDDRGRQADWPSEITRAGWGDVLRRTWSEMSEDHISLIAAGVAFYALLALFPAIAAIIAGWGMLFDPQTIEQQIDAVSGALPPQAADLIRQQASSVAANAGSGVSIAALGGLAITLYSATSGVKALIEGLNVVNDEKEGRSFIRFNLLAIMLTVVLMLTMVAALAMIVLVPIILNGIGFPSIISALASYLRWPLLAVVAIVGLGILYRYAPFRAKARLRWISWGAALATVLWIIASILFSLYVEMFASYDQTYGSIGAVIVLLMWFWISAYVVLMGAELNSEMEHQTARDSTVGEPRPMGQRGARMADTLGEER